MASDLSPNQLLDALSKSDSPVLTADAFPSVPFVKVKSVVDTLKSREMITYKTIEADEYKLTPEAEGIVANGSHEARVFEAVIQAVGGLRIKDLPVRRLLYASSSFHPGGQIADRIARMR